jgi:16S rRNA (cytosine(1402)-N(4))-methyltransferase
VRATARKNLTDPLGNSGIEHIPVMRTEVLHLLRCKPGGIYVDATLGLGGHAQAILEKILPGGVLVGIDRDKESLERAHSRLKPFSGSCRLFHDNFKNLPLILNNLATKPVDGILLDLGVSSYQLLSPQRGFSFQSDAMLDMRMDRTTCQRMSWPMSFIAMGRNDSPVASRPPLYRNAGRLPSFAARS